MFSEYFENWDVKSEFEKEFISIFDGWLGAENLHKLDEVTKEEWSKFNQLLRMISEKYELHIVNLETKISRVINDIDEVLSDFEESMNKDSSAFTRIIIPELRCVLSEDWDYTYILWHKNNGTIEALSPMITSAGLKHFHESAHNKRG